MKYCFDIDGTICSTDDSRDYTKASPYQDMIDEVNSLYEKGNEITMFTARGSSSGIDWHKLTVSQLENWGVKYHKLIDQGKPSWDLFIDDKALNAEDFRKKLNKKVGFVASCWDLLHAGHCLFLKDAKSQCDHLIAGLQTDPTIDRPEKNKPILSFEERKILIESNRYVDEIMVYETEKDLQKALENIRPDVRILGNDYYQVDTGGPTYFTGMGTEKEIYYHDRKSHGWASSGLRKRIFEAELNKS